MNKTTASLFFGIILIGLVISFFSLRGCGEKVELTIPPLATVPPDFDDEEPAEPSKAKAPVPAKGAEATSAARTAAAPATPEVAEKPSATGPVDSLFKTPEAAMAALAEKIGARDFAAFSDLVGEGGIAGGILNEVKALVEGRDLKLDPAKPFVEISKSAEGLRWAFNFVPANPAASDAEPRQLYTDLTVTPGKALDIAKISLPFALARVVSPAGSPVAPGVAPSVPAPAAQAADALTVAHAFSKAVIARDFATARALADPATVTDERVAALMIAIEEGKFALRAERPLVVTLSREDITWVLARVDSGAAASEFAVELGKIDQAWKVNGLTFSKVLSALSEAGGAGKVAYSPIVEDPSGGDSLVLYFEFDDAGLTPRTHRQLTIVADILKEGAERVIRINGHADALGSDDYNVNLSDRRAETIRQTLIGLGVKPEQVVTEAFGAAKPRKPNFLPDGSDNPSGRSQNRRAEVLLDF
jgi:outer membrane protein OmpA-like peptidoglycan-associated protein/predicted small lipoprotein YifL